MRSEYCRRFSSLTWLTTVSRVSNPLADVPLDVLMQDVEDFAREKELTDVTDLLKKGARIAQDPTNYEQIETLDQTERDALRFEVEHKWRHPFKLYFTIVVCSIGAAVQYVVRSATRLIFTSPD